MCSLTADYDLADSLLAPPPDKVSLRAPCEARTESDCADRQFGVAGVNRLLFSWRRVHCVWYIESFCDTGVRQRLRTHFCALELFWVVARCRSKLVLIAAHFEAGLLAQQQGRKATAGLRLLYITGPFYNRPT